MVSWGTVQSLVLFFGPLVLPKAIAYYKSIKNKPASQIKPLQQRTSYALAILFVSGLVAFLTTLPLFSPENVFRVTKSRLHTSGGVLLTRLQAVRSLTPADEKLREIFDAGGLEVRLLYARYGPEVLLNNTLGKAGEISMGRNFLIYAVPSLVAPHLLHLIALGVATSGLLSGKEGARWRTIAIIAGLLLGVVEVYWVANYDDTSNLQSVKFNDIDFVYWKMQVYRGFAIAATDGLLGWVIWLQATGRAFLAVAPASERILDHAQRLESILLRARGVGVVRNGSVRDASLRRKVEDYWTKESEIMKDVMEQPEVLEAQRNALRRIDSVGTGREAEQFIDHVLGIPPA
ncbi:hypothetical protein Slin15195_G118600 [Septoria linicola]|uniref:Uncharacterized protein n=1 Tax=Septoria linicola TaxID=215465 RepID=A0A9Q9B8Y5_9PEZI|nr:hypothetical protein Slin14017_G095590 [Septoria linicola]USW58541.1 hypothetical protein Slin15195_G118600 [Septoria linicola]